MGVNYSVASWWRLLATAVLFTTTHLHAQPLPDDTAIDLTATPDSCVSLRQGLVCYQRITLRWQAEVADNYCLNSQATNRPIKCWNNATRGSASYNFKSTGDTTFSLVLQHDPQVLARTEVTVSWVYQSQSRRRRSWRLF